MSTIFFIVGFKKISKILCIFFQLGHVSFFPKFDFSFGWSFCFNRKFIFNQDSLMVTHAWDNLGILVEIQMGGQKDI